LATGKDLPNGYAGFLINFGDQPSPIMGDLPDRRRLESEDATHEQGITTMAGNGGTAEA